MVKRMALKVQMMTQKCILKGVKDKEIEGLFCVSREGGPQGLTTVLKNLQGIKKISIGHIGKA